MASLVTLGASPYSAYNTSFAGIALQGLGMAQREMEQRDQLAQQSYQNYMKSVQFGADLLFKGQEMQLAKRKMDFTVDQAMFERKMAVEDQAFRKEQFTEQKRQFNVGSGFEERRVGLAEEKFQFDQKVYDEAEPVRDMQQTNAAITAAGNYWNLQWAKEDRPLGVRTREIQNATAIANTAIGFQNADVAAMNAETSHLNAQTRREQALEYDRNRAAGIRAYDAQIKQKQDNIDEARKQVATLTAKIKGSKETSPAVKQAEANIGTLLKDLEELQRQKREYEIRYGNAQTGGPTDAEQRSRTAEDDFLYRRRHGIDGRLFPANTGDSTYD